ncbi:MAG: hypothetical protein HQ519_05625 [Planctomycetes bacterium]|nr:hypothetical protein [Planctomycetota bacterium]
MPPITAIQIYSFLHVASAFLLVGLTFKIFAKPNPASRKTSLMMGGILALLMLVGGFGLQARYELGFPGWLIVKIVCWLVLSAMAGMAYRKPASIGSLVWLTRLVVLIAVAMVYFRPF